MKQGLTRSEQKKQDIIVAAKRMFKEHGVQSTSMDKLAEAANVSKRTVYNHFETKEALVMHLVTELWHTAMVNVDANYCSDAPLAPQLEALLRVEVELLSNPEYIDLSRVAISHFFFKQDALQEEVSKISKQETAIYKWIELAINDKRLAIDDVMFANTQLHSLIKGSGFWPQIIGMTGILSDKEREQLIKESVKMFLLRYEK
ncbi:TetR/AcrR family transcriptional regulator [Thalassotalea euphylliae]|uniref:TetR/AcrR family transcriptional regulator n=1 Tax=Thalassotalea euphylliae TaxID=1655234 RepID=UPI0036426239